MRTTLLFLLLAKLSLGQTPYIDSTSHWHEQEIASSWGIPDTVFIKDYVYNLNGDSVLNAITYFKLFRTGTDSAANTLDGGYSISTFNQYYGLLREDSNRVYFVPSWLTSERLLYDFNLSLGDTVPYSYGFPSCSPGTIYSTDSFYFDGQPRERLFVAAMSNTGQVRIFQGIGANSGLLGAMCMQIDGINSCLKGYYNSKDTIQFTNCSSVFTMINKTENYIANVRPNPFSTQLTFSLADNEQTTVSLYNFLGQQVFQQSFTNSTTINTEQLTDGIYFYELRNDKGTLKTGKVVKQ